MAEYINREEAYEDFEKCNGENPKWTPSRVKSLIARQKAADVAPVRHGRITNRGHMKKYKLLSQALIFALIIIAAVVAFILAAGKSAWILIIVYWIVLTAKNIVDLIVFRKNK